MGALLAIFIVLAVNLAPESADSIVVNSYVVEGVGVHTDANSFLLTRGEGGDWHLHNAFGEAWYVVSVDGPRLTLSDAAADYREQVDMGAALGLPDEPWWLADAIEPPGGVEPLALGHLPNGLNVGLEGMLAAEIRW